MERTEMDRENFEALIEKDFIETDKMNWLSLILELNFKNREHPVSYNIIFTSIIILNGKKIVEVLSGLGILNVKLYQLGKSLML